ncbi:MAG TPA: MarC family protein [Chloroflexota bacterium]|jgi:multiple antibiotic resistance protein
MDEAARALSLDLGTIFTYFFLMLGPLKLIGPFAKLTAGTDPAFQRMLALRAFAIACGAGLVAAIVGQKLLQKWDVSLPALLLAAGLVLLLVALQTVLHQYHPEPPPAPPAEPGPPHAPSLGLALTPLAFPSIITPYGSAVLILLLAASSEMGRDLAILGMFVAVMVVDLLAMLFAHQILKAIGLTPLVVLGGVLGVLQVGLAMQMLVLAGKLLRLVPA